VTALPNLFATTAHDHGGGRARADVFAPDDGVRLDPPPFACELFSTRPTGSRRRRTDATGRVVGAPAWMPTLLATVDAAGTADASDEDVARAEPRAATCDPPSRVVRRRRRARRPLALRRLRPSWTFTTGDARLP
jgi:hypothetical protein